MVLCVRYYQKIPYGIFYTYKVPQGTTVYGKYLEEILD
jgi:hypothetical protein